MNRLQFESSPYLRQHADNPVDWYPWGPEAFEAARTRDRPVLLSVGYSACHWCHVMAHESFENDTTAALMNRLFVNVKVDREERPDVDAIYMEATQAMTGSGGWPMTVFMTPDGEPFYCGTYFGPTARGGNPSFTELCEAIDDAWSHRRDELSEQASRLTEFVRRQPAFAAGATTDTAELLERAAAGLIEASDPAFGGFGRPPKFPQSMSIDFLLRRALRTGTPEPLAAATRSLDAMAAGGIYDHLGGGFARYSTDDRWLVPHFEKMLYDNALLLRPYLHAWQLTGSSRYREVITETVDYLLGTLAPGAAGTAMGGFYSAEDADSLDSTGTSVEGAYYVWTIAEVRAVLGDDASTFIDWYGVSETGNFEGANILFRPFPDPAGPEPDGIRESRRRLLEVRRGRPAPGLDDKVLTEWNALTIASLAEAADALGRPDWRAAAVAAGEFLWSNLRTDSGRWLRSWQESSGAQHLAYAQDYAALVDAFVRLYEATGQLVWLDRSTITAEALIELFWDPEPPGGFFTTGADAPPLLTRPKEPTDNATPSANSTGAMAFTRLAALLSAGHPLVSQLQAVTAAILDQGRGLAAEHPLAFANLLLAIELENDGVTEAVITGDRPDLLDVVRERWRPNVVLAWGEAGTGTLWDGRSDGLAYVCRNHACQRPASTPAELREQLS